MNRFPNRFSTVPKEAESFPAYLDRFTRCLGRLPKSFDIVSPCSDLAPFPRCILSKTPNKRSSSFEAILREHDRKRLPVQRR